MGKTRNAYKVLVRKTPGKNPLGKNREGDGRIPLRRILGRVVRIGNGWDWLGIVLNGRFWK
jgi:hypothetical protein